MRERRVTSEGSGGGAGPLQLAAVKFTFRDDHLQKGVWGTLVFEVNFTGWGYPCQKGHLEQVEWPWLASVRFREASPDTFDETLPEFLLHIV